MINFFFYKLLQYYKILKYDIHEKNFIFFLKKYYKKKTLSKQVILVNGYQDYYSLIFSFLLNKEKKFKNYNLFVYLPIFYFNKFNYKKNILFFFIFFYFNLFKSFLINKKWKYLYSITAIKTFYFKNINFLVELNYLKKSEKILEKCKNKLDLKLLKYKNILVGDLIYDTYLRFTGEPTVDLKSHFLVEILSKTIQLRDYLNNMSKKFNIKYFMSKQNSYIFHGLPFRLFQKTKVVSYHFDNHFNYLREQSRNLRFLRRDFKKFPKIFLKLKNKNSKLKEAQKLLDLKFNGNIIHHEKWMPLSVYHKKDLNINKKIKINAVIFMHDFVDSPTSRGDCLYVDFYHWIIETLEFFKRKGLEKSVVIKPHPNSQPDSIKFENFLKNKYNEFIWIDRNASNLSIFKLKPKCGISVYGSVLHELAYHDIIPISAGTNPCMAYKFVQTAKSKNEYYNLINKAIKSKKKFKTSKKLILEMTYCYYLFDDFDEESILKKLNLKNYIDENNSSSLKVFQRLFLKKIDYFK